MIPWNSKQQWGVDKSKQEKIVDEFNDAQSDFEIHHRDRQAAYWI